MGAASLELCLLTRRQAVQRSCSNVWYREGRELPGIYHTGIMALCAARHVLPQSTAVDLHGTALGGVHGSRLCLCATAVCVRTWYDEAPHGRAVAALVSVIPLTDYILALCVLGRLRADCTVGS